MTSHFILGLGAIVILMQSTCAAAPGSGNEPRTVGDPIRLFSGKHLDDWAYRSADNAMPLQRVWSVQNGVLVCTGKPTGYILAKRALPKNYLLNVEWRWPGAGGNSGVFVHYSEKDGALPKALEVQLASGDAGDFWAGDGVELDVEDEERRKSGQRYRNLTDGSERPLGEWNAMQIICRGDEVIVKINGKLVNHATRCTERQGAIALQSEGTPIEFRTVELRKLAE